MGDLVPIVKRRLTELRSRKNSVRNHTEVWKGQILGLRSLRLGS